MVVYGGWGGGGGGGGMGSIMTWAPDVDES